MVEAKKDVVAKLQDLERCYRLVQHPSVRHPNFFEWLLICMNMRKPPFQPGDDVWTRMERETRSFVEEMSGRP